MPEERNSDVSQLRAARREEPVPLKLSGPGVDVSTVTNPQDSRIR